jgi:hypothetical protein
LQRRPRHPRLRRRQGLAGRRGAGLGGSRLRRLPRPRRRRRPPDLGERDFLKAWGVSRAECRQQATPDIRPRSSILPSTLSLRACVPSLETGAIARRIRSRRRPAGCTAAPRRNPKDPAGNPTWRNDAFCGDSVRFRAIPGDHERFEAESGVS